MISSDSISGGLVVSLRMQSADGNSYLANIFTWNVLYIRLLLPLLIIYVVRLNFSVIRYDPCHPASNLLDDEGSCTWSRLSNWKQHSWAVLSYQVFILSFSSKQHLSACGSLRWDHFPWIILTDVSPLPSSDSCWPHLLAYLWQASHLCTFASLVISDAFEQVIMKIQQDV